MWCSRKPDELPCRKLAPLQRNIFAAYSGPADGLCHVQKLKKQQQTSPYKRGKVALVCGSDSWIKKNRKAYGLATTLYDQHPINKRISGDPIADSFALCARANNSLLVMADGVNWGEKSMLAARCAVYGAVEYIHDQLFDVQTQPLKTTHDAFHLLLKSLEAAHTCILENEGGLTTLCVALILPTRARAEFAVCVVNVGDSLAYVYSKAKGGVREITTGSHDISSERDIRDAGGALGPVCGTNPELNNLTCSLTYVQAGDIVFLTTDGISDNYDPVVTKIAASDQPKSERRRPSNQMDSQENGGKKEENKSADSYTESASQSASQENNNSMQSQSKSDIKGSGETSPNGLSPNANNTVDSSTPEITNQSFNEQQGNENGNTRTNKSSDTKNDSPVMKREINKQTPSASSQYIVENYNSASNNQSAGQITTTSPVTNATTHKDNANDTSPTDNASCASPDSKSSYQSVSPTQNIKPSSSKYVDNRPASMNLSSPPSGLSIKPVDTSILRNKPQKRSLEAESIIDQSNQDTKAKQKENRRQKTKSLPIKIHWKRRHEAKEKNEKKSKARTPEEKTTLSEAPTLSIRSPGAPNVVSNPSYKPEMHSKPQEMHSKQPEMGSNQPETDVEGMKDGRPVMAPTERHQYACRQMERVLLEYELMTEDNICAQELCGALLHHVLTLTNEKRTVLEDPSLYGRRRKLTPEERKARDAAIVARMARAPGKLDHASIVAYEVGYYKGDQDENYELTSAKDVWGSQDDSQDESRDSSHESADEPEVTSSVTAILDSRSCDTSHDVTAPRDKTTSHDKTASHDVQHLESQSLDKAVSVTTNARKNDVTTRGETNDVITSEDKVEGLRSPDVDGNISLGNDDSMGMKNQLQSVVESLPAPNPMAVSLDIPFIDDSEEDDSEREQ